MLAGSYVCARVRARVSACPCAGARPGQAVGLQALPPPEKVSGEGPQDRAAPRVRENVPHQETGPQRRPDRRCLTCLRRPRRWNT
nr:MAG TPA: hypothetical protein [Caudoviricetes sp.]